MKPKLIQKNIFESILRKRDKILNKLNSTNKYTKFNLIFVIFLIVLLFFLAIRYYNKQDRLIKAKNDNNF